MAHADAPKKSDAALREEEILAFWNERNIFQKTLEKEAPEGEFVFYDGPPFATGLPHHGHILAGTIKDTIPRYQTMRGKRVRRRWGWDCHGLPLENLIEKKLNLSTKRDIEEMGVEKFNEACRDAVLEYADDWKRIVPRLGRWADMEDDYKTMDATYTESVWWVFHKLHEKNLVYEGFKSMHLCPRCGTTLSNFEVNLGYKDIKDIAVTVRLPLLDAAGNVTDTSLLVWTTTPWTLPGNMAAAVHKDFEYAKVRVPREDGLVEYVILAKDRVGAVVAESHELVEVVKGSTLVGKSYKPPFAYFKEVDIKGKENAWKIYHADYVELGEEGTGAVHLAPAYGDEDMVLAKAHGVPIVHHVDKDGRFLPLVTDFAGKLVKPKDDKETGVLHTDTDVLILQALKSAGILFKKENITHSYPHCWRCDTPLLNYATTSWFVRVTDIKDRLVEENNKIHWVPEHVGSARFGDWLENARDWAVSRQRYWGAPLPIWKNKATGDHKVFGSLAELKKYVPRSGNSYTIMRHGEAEHNVKNITSSDINAEHHLTKRGREQVQKSAAALKGRGIDLIIASPYLRTRETVAVIREALELPEDAVVFDDRIGEIQMGVFDGRPAEEYWKFWPETKERFIKRPEGGENLADVRMRVGGFLYEIDSRYEKQNILIVTHDTPALMLHATANGMDKKGLIATKDAGEYFMMNAEARPLDFVPMPHNRSYELDYHRPFIDEIELVDEDGERLVRVPDVFDCWFESGSMPYGQQHYPFEHTDVFDPEKGRGYPADFIAEGLDQTRGWFYSLIVLGAALFGQSPYKSVIVNGHVLAEDGKKMSKSLKNYPDPMNVVDAYGADTLRFYLLSSSIIKGEDLNFTEKNVAELGRKNIGRLGNVLSFYELYKDGAVDTRTATDSKNILDVWIIARLNELVRDVTNGMESYELDRATRPITDFIDDLSVWYLRRSRERLKSEDAVDRATSLATLRFVLRELALVMAPSMPFFSEYLYQRVRTHQDPESVHLASWPLGGEVNTALISAMSSIRSYATIGLKLREQKKVNVRQPLQSFTITQVGETPQYWKECTPILADELNVKEVLLTPAAEADSADFDWVVTAELRLEGLMREITRAIQDARKAKGLNPTDKVQIQYETNDIGQSVLDRFGAEIRSTVSASVFISKNLERSGTIVPFEGGEFVFEIIPQ